MGLQAAMSPDAIPVPARKPFYRQLYVQVLTAIALGALVGHLFPEVGSALKPLGDGFIKLVKMIIAPVIFLTIVTGIAGMTHLRTVGRVFAKAMTYFLFFSTLALIVGMVVAHVVQPGAGMNVNVADLDQKEVRGYVDKTHELTITGFLLDIIPREKAGQAMAMWGAGIMVGPIIGPTLGGWLTDHLSWRWVFYINVPIGLFCTAMTWALYRDRETPVRRMPVVRTRPMCWTFPP